MNNKNKVRAWIIVIILILLGLLLFFQKKAGNISTNRENNQVTSVNQDTETNQTSTNNKNMENNNLNQKNTQVGTTVKVAKNDTYGDYLVDSQGMALYLFVNAKGESQPCTTEACLATWPIVTSQGNPLAGEGLNKNLLGTILHPNNSNQVTYHTWPLWYFAGDNQAGDINGQGISSFGGTWYLISPTGEAITK